VALTEKVSVPLTKGENKSFLQNYPEDIIRSGKY
jgi:hypothetical protein